MFAPKGDGWDVIVIGAGHAGCEAALAAARMGCRVLLLTMSLDSVALMPCNPSIGGPAKAHLVREIDALGGEMARITDASLVQIRMLNTKKGPAVQALRGQIDRKLYQQTMRQRLEDTPQLYLKEAAVEGIDYDSGHRTAGVHVRTGCKIRARAVVIASGTYLRAVVHMGKTHFSSGPQNLHSSEGLAGDLAKRFSLRRFKTGTPPRINLRSICKERMTIQPGSSELRGFSFDTAEVTSEQVPCWLTYTNEQTHAIIRDHLDEAALFSGAITGVGPRYCPSIESKVCRFPDRLGHQVFVEPEGFDTSEGYLSGLSSSLPPNVQQQILETIPGLEDVEMMRPGYAIEYDCLDPRQLDVHLGMKGFPGLYCAGQINGTSGYEEAAAQGLLAGINAARYCLDKEGIALDRSEAYMAVLIDDLVTKGTEEPYRIMTSRAEYRLLLRQDNADERLTPLGHKLGLISSERHQAFQKKQQRIADGLHLLRTRRLSVDEQIALGFSAAKDAVSLAQLLRRPEVPIARLVDAGLIDPASIGMAEVMQEVETRVKYEGYLRKQERAVERVRELEEVSLSGIDYEQVSGLSQEAKEKLTSILPKTLGQAGRIAGISPADLSVIMIHLRR